MTSTCSNTCTTPVDHIGVTPDIDLDFISVMCKIKKIPQNERVPVFFFLSYTMYLCPLDIVTYTILEQQSLKRACTFVQSRQIHHCLHTQSMKVDQGSDQGLEL